MSDRTVTAADVDADRREHAATDVGDGTARPGLVARLRAIGTGSVTSLIAREYRICGRTRRTAGIAVLFAAFSTVVAVAAGNRPVATVATLVELSVYLVPLAALTFGYDAVAGARETGTLDTLLVLPIDRRVAFLGVAIGRAVAFASGLVGGLAVGGIVLVATAGPAVLATYVPYALLSVAVGTVGVVVSVTVSGAVREKARALGAVLLVWVWATFVHDLLAVSLLTTVSVPSNVITAVLVANPAGLYRVAALGLLPTAGADGTTLVAAGLSPGMSAITLTVWTGFTGAVGAVVFARRTP